jgi:surface protein
MDFLNPFITATLCLTMAAASIHQQPPDGQTGAPQPGQTSGTGRHDTTPHAAPALATKTQRTDAPQSGKAAGPQDNTGTCTHTGPQTWGTPADDAAVNKVPSRDPAPIQWEIGSDCTLTLHHGTSPEAPGGDGPSKSDAPWLSASFINSITKIHIDGNVTLYSDLANMTGFFTSMPALREVRVDGTLHLAGAGAEQLFAHDGALADFTGDGLKDFETSQATDMSSMFVSCNQLTSMDLSSFDTRNVTDMSGMFDYCPGLTSLDVSSFDTRNVGDMNRMFQICNQLTSLDLSNFDTRNVTDMNSMFSGCNQLTSLDLSNFDTRNVTDMRSMFTFCPRLTSLDLSGFDTRNVTDMSEMFQECSGLTSLDVHNFDTSNAGSLGEMFEGCTGLTSLNISHFDTRKALAPDGYIARILGGDSGLRELWLGPNTYLTKTDDDSSAFLTGMGPGFAYDVWLELPATGPHIPVSDLRARTSLTSPRTPQGHYIIPSLTLTVDYDNGQADHTETTVTDTSKTAGSQTVALGPRPTPAGKVFDGWRLTTSDPEHVTLHGDTVSWTAKAYDPDARITATWRTPAAQPGHNQTPGQPNNRNRDPNRPADPATAGKDPDALALTGTTATQALTLLAALLTLATTLLATTKRHTHRHTRTHTR